MSEARKAFQSKAEQERDAELNRKLGPAWTIEKLEALESQGAKLERMLRSIGATDPEEAAE